jgi:hypothetical protein
MCPHQWRTHKQIVFAVRLNAKDSSAMCSLRKKSLSRKKHQPKKLLRKKPTLIAMATLTLLPLRRRLPPRKLPRKKLLPKKQSLNLSNPRLLQHLLRLWSPRRLLL